jgi:predicted O-methyltransferase YrrM
MRVRFEHSLPTYEVHEVCVGSLRFVHRGDGSAVAMPSWAPMLDWMDDKYFTIGDTTFVTTKPARLRSTADRFFIVKSTAMMDRYAALLDELEPRNIVELGIYAGGSTAFFAEAARPEMLVACDISTDRVEALDEFVARHHLEDAVALHYGVDQGDTARLREIVTEHFGAKALDLVADDASHALELTRASFNVLFPRLRPGGMYVIEDWGWAHNGYGMRPDEKPLTLLMFEIVMSMPLAQGVVAELHISPGLLQIRRGDAPVDAETFDISRMYDERSRALINGL